MKILKSKTIAILIALFLIISMAASVTMIPATNAAQLNVPTYAYINVSPEVVGLGQTITVGIWLGLPPPTANGVYGDRWQNFMVTVTNPSGKNETLGPFNSDDTGGTYALYTPNALGNYTFQMSYPGQTLAGTNLPPASTLSPSTYQQFLGAYFQPSMSKPVTITVQQDPVPSIPVNPLPTSYWTRPINANNNNWFSVGGNWLSFGQIFSGNTGNYNLTGNYNPYSLAPTTSHILWTKPELFGGTMGGEFGGSETGNYYTTSQYEPKFAPIIINGVLYSTAFPGSSTNPTGWVALDLRSGQTLWASNAPLTSGGACTILRCGQVLDYVSPNQFGGIAYLWSTGTPAFISNAAPGSTTYNMFDANTGNYILSIVNGTTMFLTEDQSGDLIGYYTNTTNPNAPTLNMWNSTQAILYPTGQPAGYSNWRWLPPQNGTINFKAGIMWTVPMPTNISGVTFPQNLALTSTGSITNLAFINSGVALMASQPNIGGTSLYTTGFRIEAGFDSNTGALLWITNRTETPYTRCPIYGAGYGVYVEVNHETGVITGYSLYSGLQVWGPVTLTNTNPYDVVGGYQTDIADGVLYIYGFGGDIYGISLTNGTILWSTTTNQITGEAGTDTPYGVWPIWTQPIPAIANGILFLGEGHEYSPPLFRGAQQLAINITNGKPVWSISAFDVTIGGAIADGIFTTLNSYDNQIYAYGQGPSATTVMAPQVGVTTETPLTITGTVMDTSAGSKQQAVVANFPNGLPCVSDASMTQWMEYIYMQQLLPKNTTGVPVTLSVIDSNNNFRTIGTTTSDTSGTFALTWTPDIPGNFTVIAAFTGSGSYYGSSAETHFYASAAAATPAPTATVQSNVATTTDLMLYIVSATVAIIIAIAIGFALVLRKRP